jgi:hypothetical protein
VGRLQETLRAAVAAADRDLALLSAELDGYASCPDALLPMLVVADDDGHENAALVDLLDQTGEDLLEAYMAFALDRRKVSFMAVRGIMEGLFSALYYRYQALSRTLWARDASFQLVHTFFETSSKNEFFLFFKPLFDEDEDFKKRFPGCGAKLVFKEAEDVYAKLSRFIHKKYGPTAADFNDSVAAVFRIFLTFVDRTDDISAIPFPTPRTWPEAKFGRGQ